MNILIFSKKYTDENHRLSRRKSLKFLTMNDWLTEKVLRNLMNLIEFGYDIEYSESLRVYKNKHGKEIRSLSSDFYLNRDFSDGELRLLIDSLFFQAYPLFPMQGAC